MIGIDILVVNSLTYDILLCIIVILHVNLSIAMINFVLFILFVIVFTVNIVMFTIVCVYHAGAVAGDPPLVDTGGEGGVLIMFEGTRHRQNPARVFFEQV